ncbi:MAG: DNA methyltransferase [Candidatus Subteraquimicrobiales bacterium]|nr:DNA methyltransferase [Candidatus Subteraquimicrobiales bacterium]
MERKTGLIYHETELGTLYHGDCLQVMKQFADKSFDLCLTDPPYGVDGGHGGQLKDYKKADYISFIDTPENIIASVVPAVNLCLLLAKTVVLTPGTRCLTFYPQPDDMGVFYQPANSRIGKFGFQTAQPIFYYGYYKNAGKGALHTSYVLTEAAEKNGHPCPKPIKAWTWLLLRCSDRGNLVLDPFAGSGTTAIACIRTNRRYVMIEKEEKYCEIAAKRIDTELAQTDFLRGEE